MKMITTRSIKKAIYNFETAEKIYERRVWSDDDPEIKTFKAIEGGEAYKYLKNHRNLKIKGTLSDDVYYIFRWNKKHNGLVPYHVTMKRKTILNLEKGSRKFGSLSILNEVV